MTSKVDPKSAPGQTRDIGHAKVTLVTAARSVKAQIYYEGGPYELEPAERILKVVSGRSEAEALEKAEAWLAKQSADKIRAGCCLACSDGQALVAREQKGLIQVHCDACGVVLHRGPM